MPNPALSVRLGADKIARLTTHWPATVNLKRTSRYFDVRIFDQAQGEHLDRSVLSHVVLHSGNVYVNGQPVAAPTFGRKFVRFAHKTATSYTSGVLNFTPDGLAFTGRLYLGTTERDAQPHEVVGVTPPTVFKTRIARTGAVPDGTQKFPDWSPPEPKDTDTAQWEEGLDLTVGYRFTEAGNLPEPICQIGPSGKNDPVEISDNCALSINPKTQNLVVTLASNTGVADLVAYYGKQFPGAFTVEFEDQKLEPSFRGEMQRFNAATGQNETMQFAWHGIPLPNAAVKVVPAMLAAAFPQAAVSLASDLNKAELFTLQPDAKKLQDDQMSMLVENMKWALQNNDSTKDWTSNFFGEKIPKLSLSQDRKDLINKNPAFYTDRFAVIYLGSSFNKMSGQGAPTTKLDDTQSKNLEFYMRAGLAYEKGYNVQSQGVFLQAFIESTPRLRDYIQDQNPKDPAHDWATQLFNELTTPYQINQAVLKVIAGHGTEDVNRHSTVLLALQPGGKLSQQYHTMITNASMSRTFDHLKLDDKEALTAWLGDSIQGFIDALTKGTLKIEGMDPETQARLLDQARELEIAAQAAGSVAKLAARLADLTIAAGGKDTWEKLANAQTFWGKAGYRFASMIYGLAIVGGLGAAIMSFMNWKKLTIIQRMQVIVSVVQTAALLIKSIPKIIGAVGDAGKWTFNQIGEFYRSCSAPNVVDNMTEAERLGFADDESEFPDPMETGAKNIGDMADPETGVLELGESTWTKTFNDTVGVVCEVIGVLAAVAFALLSTCQFLEDLDSGAPMKTKVLDGIIMAANIGMAICAVIGLVSGGTLVPILGAIFAIIGIVASLIQMFWPTPPPPSPVEVFMKDHLVPAASGDKRWILDAPADWGTDKTVPQHNVYNPAKAAYA